MNPLRELNRSHWAVQPYWAKALTVIVGIPAWLVFAYNIVVSNEPDDRIIRVAFGLFMTVCLLQLALVARGYWRNDI